MCGCCCCTQAAFAVFPGQQRSSPPPLTYTSGGVPAAAVCCMAAGRRVGLTVLRAPAGMSSAGIFCSLLHAGAAPSSAPHTPAAGRQAGEWDVPTRDRAPARLLCRETAACAPSYTLRARPECSRSVLEPPLTHGQCCPPGSHRRGLLRSSLHSDGAGTSRAICHGSRACSTGALLSQARGVTERESHSICVLWRARCSDLVNY
jgi:hypothetical protein